jgi:D-lactate dehydrogenase
MKDEDRDALGFEYAELDEIYAQADIISIHLPLDNNTKDLINAQSIQKMKKGVILINTARGGLIDTKALIDALKSGQIGGAGLDVYENEQKYFFNDFSSHIVDDDILIQLMSYPNVIITAHQAFLTQEALCSIAKTTFENIHAFTSNGKPMNSPKM